MTSHKDAKEKRSKEKDVVAVKREEYEKLKETARLYDEFKDKYLRAHAELDNVRKRFAKELEDYVKYANEGLLSEMLYVSNLHNYFLILFLREVRAL